MQKVREAERNKQYEEYKEKIGTIINGTVKRVEFGNVIIDMGKTEAVLRRDEIIPRENFKNGEPRSCLCAGCPSRNSRTADFPFSHLSGIYGQAVYVRSAGNL